jgi:hypothetical protein
LSQQNQATTPTDPEKTSGESAAPGESTRQPRWRSWPVWLSTAALVYFILDTWCGIKIPGWLDFLKLLAPVLIGFGIVNNPTDSGNF